MKKQITHISPVQTAKVLALLYFMLSIPFVVFMVLSLWGMPSEQRPSVFFLVFLPLFYLVFGFISTAIGAWGYNLVAKRVGGIEYTSNDQPG